MNTLKMGETPSKKLIIKGRRFHPVMDRFSVPRELNLIAQQFKDGGWEIKRGESGAVILPLSNGEIQYIPTANGIEELIFEN